MKNDLLKGMKTEAAKLAAGLPKPAFYAACAEELELSRELFFDKRVILKLQEEIIPYLYDDFGHGIQHAKKVAIEAGGIIYAEIGGQGMPRARRLALLAQMAGLLHDVCRMEENHAERGAEIARSMLSGYPLEPREIEAVAFAISDHAAPAKAGGDPDARLVADALYDADLLRFGPDIFASALWEFCDYEEATPQGLLGCFPQALGHIHTATDTFRTKTGKRFGPEFLSQGLTLGQILTERLGAGLGLRPK